jgi:hypothetical protein
MRNSNYRYLVQSIDGVVQLIAASYLRHGFYWYVTGWLPDGKDPVAIDRKLMEKYEINISEWARAHRKKRGLANVHYVRHDNWFILLISEGHHPIKRPSREGGESESIKDCRRVPIKFAGYSISYRRAGNQPAGRFKTKWHAHVAIDVPTYRQLKSHFEHLAVHRKASTLEKELAEIPFARYAPVRRQLLHILRKVNKLRGAHNDQLIPYSKLRLSRRPVKVFIEHDSSDQEQSPTPKHP